MQQQIEKKSTDGGRLESLKSTTGKTWVQLARELGISRSMLFAVLSGSKRLGRDNLAVLDRLEKEKSTLGELDAPPKADAVRERPEPYGTPEMLRAENEALKAELRQAMETISNLSKALARREHEGRAMADGPPANLACGANCGSSPAEDSKSA